jgi:hypothetical protein
VAWVSASQPVTSQRQRVKCGGEGIAAQRIARVAALRARLRDPPGGARGRGDGGLRAIAQAIEFGAQATQQQRAATEQAQAAADLQQQAVVALGYMRDHGGAELIAPAGKLVQCGGLAFGVAGYGDQVTRQRLGRGQFQPRRDAGCAGAVIGEGDQRPLRRAVGDDHGGDRQGPRCAQVVQRARGQLQRQCGKGEGKPESHGTAGKDWNGSIRRAASRQR